MITFPRIGEALGRLLFTIATILFVAMLAVIAWHLLTSEDRIPAGPPPSTFPQPQPVPQPVVEPERPMPTTEARQPADSNPTATNRADKLGGITGQREPEIEGTPPFRARVNAALTLLRERSPTGYQYILHLNVIREGTANEMRKTAWGPAAAQTINCGRRNAGATLGPDSQGPGRDAAYLAHEAAHVALGLCGPNAHADGRVYAVDLLVRYELEDAGFAAYESFTRKVIAAEGGL